MGLPLGDPFMSRQPLLFAPAGEGIRLIPAKEGRCTCAGEPLHGSREFGAEELALGIPLEFSGRVEESDLNPVHQAAPNETVIGIEYSDGYSGSSLVFVSTVGGCSDPFPSWQQIGLRIHLLVSLAAEAFVLSLEQCVPSRAAGAVPSAPPL